LIVDAAIRVRGWLSLPKAPTVHHDRVGNDVEGDDRVEHRSELVLSRDRERDLSLAAGHQEQSAARHARHSKVERGGRQREVLHGRGRAALEVKHVDLIGAADGRHREKAELRTASDDEKAADCACAGLAARIE
jgi:hypothetical protein